MLTVRERVGLNVPPVLLRLCLGVIFLWAGLGKVASSAEVSGADAALLANMGVIRREPPAPPPAITAPSGKGKAGLEPEREWRPWSPLVPAAQTSTPGTGSAPGTGPGAPVGGRPAYTAADFPTPVRVLSLYRLAILVQRSASPGVGEGGKPEMALVPRGLGQGAWPARLAWAAAVTELVGGACLIVGLLTRFWSLALAGVMVVAIWLTELGPAVRSGNTVLGVLPAYGAFDVAAWQRLMFQSCCLVMALSLAALGSGRLGLDHALLSKGEDVD